MRLDSVRALKQSLRLELAQAFSLESQATKSVAVARAASLRSMAPSYFLGVAVARGSKEYLLAVRLQDRALAGSDLVRAIRAKAKGEVDVRYVGSVRARGARPKRARAKVATAPADWVRAKNRPLLIGSSIGYLSDAVVMAGTLGCFVRRSDTPRPHLLSNNHVLADENRYPIGGAIVQPGTLDAGVPATDQVATLEAFTPLRSGIANRVDCAVAELDSDQRADPTTLTGLGKLAGLGPALEVGDTVAKLGRTTGLRRGRVSAIELDGVRIGYDVGLLAFDDQIEIEGAGELSFGDAADSGALIVDAEQRAVALSFAGSDHGDRSDRGLTYASPLDAVLQSLGVDLLC
jgi:hypothetical protein